MTTAPLSPSVDNELTSQLDGVYTLFGFVLDGCDELPKICTGDVITSMRCFDGEKLRRPTFNPSYVRRRREASRDYQMLGEQNEGLGEYDGGAIPASVPLIEDAESQEQGLRYVGPAKEREEEQEALLSRRFDEIGRWYMRQAGHRCAARVSSVSLVMVWCSIGCVSMDTVTRSIVSCGAWCVASCGIMSRVPIVYRDANRIRIIG